jgi:hypothetical protein
MTREDPRLAGTNPIGWLDLTPSHSFSKRIGFCNLILIESVAAANERLVESLDSYGERRVLLKASKPLEDGTWRTEYVVVVQNMQSCTNHKLQISKVPLRIGV